MGITVLNRVRVQSSIKVINVAAKVRIVFLRSISDLGTKFTRE